MECTAEFIKYLTDLGKLEIIKLTSGYLVKCGKQQVKAANIETALMILIIQNRGILNGCERIEPRNTKGRKQTVKG